MKRFWNYLSKIYIHPITVAIILISVLSGRFIPLFIYFVIASIHEICHCIVAKIFKLKINKISIYPFGLSASIDNLSKLYPLKSIIILLVGPLSYFISLPLINLFYKFDLLSYYMFLEALEINKLILLFNILPIFPLDGFKILFYCLCFIFPLKKSYNISLIISILSTIILVILNINDPQIVILLFLVFSQIKFLFTYIYEYYNTLIHRLNTKIEYKIKLHNKKDIYLPYANYYFNDKIIMEERYLINNILNSKNK